MKNILVTAISIISLSLYGQNLTELEKEKSTLNSQLTNIELIKKNISRVCDSILAIKDEDAKRLNLTFSKTKKSKDSLNEIISTFKVSDDNFKIYNILKTERIIDVNSKKYTSFYKKMKKTFFYYLSDQQEFIITMDFIFLVKFDFSGRVKSFYTKKLSEEFEEKKTKLIEKGKIIILLNNNSFLESLTGVNADYLFYLKNFNSINDNLTDISAEKLKNDDFQKNLIFERNQKISKLDAEYNQLALSIEGVNKQIGQIDEQNKFEIQKNINSSKFKTKIVNGVEICTSPLAIREFINGDEIKKARTEGEWNKFNELKIPAYHYKDFDDNQGNYGFIYNYYAITDIRELAPIGFHKLNLIDFNYLENQSVFTDTKLVDCYCGDGIEGNYESCQNCNYWTETQRKYNVCTKCQNRRYFNRGTKKCTKCNGTKKVKAFSMVDRNFCVFPSTKNNVEYQNNIDFISVMDNNLLGVIGISHNGKCKLKNCSTEDIDVYSGPDIGFKEQGFQLLICKDRVHQYTDDFATTKIGDIEIMNTFLNVIKFRNGDPIKYIEDPVEWELALKNKIPAYCYFNNINDGKGCIYNIHAWNDKRGLMPKNWRSITQYDLMNLAFSLNYELAFNSAQSPLKPPKGVRNITGNFETIETKKNYKDINEDYFDHLNFRIKKEDYLSWVKFQLRPLDQWGENAESGYVLCVRDAQKKSLQQQNISGNNPSISGNGKFNSNLESLKIESEILNAKIANGKKLDFARDYNGIYNEQGVQLIEELVNSNFKELFNNTELKLLGLKVKADCDENDFYYSGNDGDLVYGIVLRLDDNGDLFCSFRDVSTSEYMDYNRDEIEDHEEFKLEKIGELEFRAPEGELLKRIDLGVKFSFNPFRCDASNNPMDNFHVEIGKYKAFKGDWSGDVRIFYGNGHQKKLNSAIISAVDFINNY